MELCLAETLESVTKELRLLTSHNLFLFIGTNDLIQATQRVDKG